MPNWCENSVDITGPKESLDKFIEELIENEGDTPELYFHKLLPMPANQESPTHWGLLHWGTKWDLSPEETRPLSQSDTQINYGFDTAWSPPLPFFQSISANFPELSFELNYIEPGMQFAGTSLFKGGYEVEAVSYENGVAYVQFAYEHFGYEFDLDDEDEEDLISWEL